jgi:hypothetical protein
LARSTDPGEFDDVAKITEVKSLAYVMGPLLEFGRIDLHRRSARATRKMMVVRLDDATSVQAFTSVGHDDVDFAVLDQFLQLRIDGRESDPPTVALDERVEFLGAHEAL